MSGRTHIYLVVAYILNWQVMHQDSVWTAYFAVKFDKKDIYKRICWWINTRVVCVSVCAHTHEHLLIHIRPVHGSKPSEQSLSFIESIYMWKTHIHTRLCAWIHTHTQTHTHTYIHTYIHIHRGIMEEITPISPLAVRESLVGDIPQYYWTYVRNRRKQHIHIQTYAHTYTHTHRRSWKKNHQ